jgi:1-deoxy-D-xylulose-5-phosphate reductoisomerase
MKRKRLVILGSTGSIGASTLDVVASRPEAFEVAGLAAGRNLDLLIAQAGRFRPEVVAVADADLAREARSRLGPGTRVLHGPDGLESIGRHEGVDTVVCGLVGAAGLLPTWAAIDAGRTVALANKEALVVGGAHLTARARETGATILPVDSEHNAVHQCLRGERLDEVRGLWLTASGGPFRSRAPGTLATVSPQEALRHPTWSMGRKITIDSATLMNKGLEVIEAHWLFGLAADRIHVVIHPKSVVHSMVELVDGSFKAQLGVTDMRHPIQYALTWPERWESALPRFDPVAASPLEFEHPDPERFPCLALAYRALERGGAGPAVLNAANEVAVGAFLDGAARFTDIARVIESALERHGGDPARSLEDVVAADRRARETAARMLSDGVPT